MPIKLGAGNKIWGIFSPIQIISHNKIIQSPKKKGTITIIAFFNTNPLGFKKANLDTNIIAESHAANNCIHVPFGISEV